MRNKRRPVRKGPYRTKKYDSGGPVEPWQERWKRKFHVDAYVTHDRPAKPEK